MQHRLRHGALELKRRRLRSTAWFVLIAGAYFGAAKLGLSLSVSHGVITPVWPPSGIALVALLLLGVRFWPAVALGAFFANATSDASLAVAAGIAFGNTLAAVVGTLLVRRIGFTIGLDRVRSVLALVVGGALVSTTISATNGVTVLSLADARQDSFGSAWLLWWFGDAMGVLVVAPILLVLYDARRQRLPPRARLAEAAVLTAALIGTSAIVFLGGAWRYPFVLIFPLFLWAALRFRQAGAAVSVFVAGALATWGAVDGALPLGGETATERVQLAQASFAVLAISLLVLGATLAERETASSALALLATRLGEAQAIAHIGSWEWDIRRDLVRWSDELYRVFGVDRKRAEPLSYSTYLDLVHPDDRDLADQAVKSALEDGQPFALEHRIVRPDGRERIVASRGRVVLRGKEPVKMVGTGQDVTEQRQVEKLREDILSAVSHELRTPLTSVLGFALTLEKHRESLTPETIDETVSALARAARRLDRLLSDLLDVERLRRGVLALVRERVDADELVRRVVDECAPDGRALRVDCEPVVAEVDRAKLERIVENLVVNAGKHTPNAGSIEVRLTCRGRDSCSWSKTTVPGSPTSSRRSSSRPSTAARACWRRPPAPESASRSSRSSPRCTGAGAGSRTGPEEAPPSTSFFPDCVRGVRQPAAVP